MKCYICKKETTDIDPLGDYVHINCKSCGEYKVSGTAAANPKIHNMSPDFILGRLAQIYQKTKEVPMITSNDL